MANKFVILKNSKYFENCKINGSRVFVQNKILFSFIENNLTGHRFGWTVPKNVGSAVVRNKLKRFCREFFRNNNYESKLKFDLNIVFLKSGVNDFRKMDYNDFKELCLSPWKELTKS